MTKQTNTNFISNATPEEEEQEATTRRLQSPLLIVRATFCSPSPFSSRDNASSEQQEGSEHEEQNTRMQDPRPRTTLYTTLRIVECALEVIGASDEEDSSDPLLGDDFFATIDYHHAPGEKKDDLQHYFDRHTQ